MKTALVLAALLFTAPLQGAATEVEPVDPDSVDVVDAIECRLDAPSYTGFVMELTGQDGIASKRRWKGIKSANLFLAEYDLPAPIMVAGRYSTRRIAFTSTGVVAILDQPDPAIVARTAGVENALATDPAAASPFHKFLGERVIADVTDPPNGEGFRARTVITRSVSNVTTHPGKTLYGCSYRIDPLDRDGRPL